jgi:hypothetical protein
VGQIRQRITLMQKRTFVNSGLVSTLLTGLALCTVVSISACTPFNNGRTVYDRDGLRISIDIDPSIRQTIQTDLNNHPIDLTPKELESLLQVIQVSGFSGTLVGMLTKPQPIPLFTPQELSTISEHLTMAFRDAKPTERVSFSLPKPDVTYSEDRTAGFLFFRGRYLHVVLTDHSSFIRTDTGGGDYKDIRDTKGMKLWVAGPTQAATVRDLEEPRWAHFERVHISLTVKEVLAQKENIPAARTNQGGTGTPVSPPAAVAPESRRQSVSPQDLQLQIQELSSTNQDLRGRLDEQTKRTQQLQDQIEQLRRELLPSKPKGKSFRSVPGQ